MATELTIVVSVYNREDILESTLKALAQQDVSCERYNVTVVDGGSVDATPQIISRFLDSFPSLFRYIRHPKNRGLSAARNSGWQQANSPLVLFFDSDLVACPSLVAEHLRVHTSNPQENQAVLGRVAFPPDVPRTPMKDFANQVVHMWDDLDRRSETQLDWTYFLGGNISVKRSLLERSGGFDDVIFPGSGGFEDCELGLRLWRDHGLRINYAPQAVAYHYHWREPSAVLENAQRYGYNLATWLDRHDNLEETVLLNYPWLEFLQEHPPFRIWLRERVRRSLINSRTVPIMIGVARWLEPRWEKGAAALYNKTLKHFLSIGFSQGNKESQA